MPSAGCAEPVSAVGMGGNRGAAHARDGRGLSFLCEWVSGWARSDDVSSKVKVRPGEQGVGLDGCGAIVSRRMF